MNGFVVFMASTTGRILRIAAGLALIGVGLFVVEGTGSIILAVVGLLPLGAGIFDVCVVSPLFGAPFSGAKVRRGANLPR